MKGALFSCRLEGFGLGFRLSGGGGRRAPQDSLVWQNHRILGLGFVGSWDVGSLGLRGKNARREVEDQCLSGACTITISQVFV